MQNLSIKICSDGSMIAPFSFSPLPNTCTVQGHYKGLYVSSKRYSDVYDIPQGNIKVAALSLSLFWNQVDCAYSIRMLIGKPPSDNSPRISGANHQLFNETEPILLGEIG